MLTAALALAGANAHAGRNCDGKRPDALAMGRSLDLARRAADQLDRSGAQVVVLARAGQNLDEYGLRYSHLGLAYRDGSGAAARWRVVHKLNQCGTARASIYRQGLGEFFLDDLYRDEGAMVVLAPELQARLLPLLRDNARVAQLDEPAYSMLAYPWSVRYQQSNQWALETLALAEDADATTRQRAQAWLRLKDYQPTTLHLSAFKRLGARLTTANIAFDDHPGEKRFGDRIETATVDSVFAWLLRSRLGDPAQIIR
ncbi:DUF2145 domain-containing protein [Schlegelella sp. ID0723]|uniref:DUF2145 domain-containing protein n=2 Tax=Piscinibacter koreensis TaxID=2742824 RepID=A0A7Y6TUW6_9BURK|nr:DUF2145 domain-containing protein [Schlegelella koreensis]NUZ04311.1 DUF2145 domain-containing protein [Schlegelella koreensis]